MELCKNIEKADYNKFIDIMKLYLPDSDESLVNRMYEKYKNTFVGYYIDDLLVGICYGWPRREAVADDESYTIEGIAIIHPFNAQGRGPKLLAYFEQRVKELGFFKISVGSADGYVERFYLKNGYIPKEYKVLRNDKEAYVHKILTDQDYHMLNRNELIQRVKGYHGFIVLCKDIQKDK